MKDGRDNQMGKASVLLLIAHVLIGGWAFIALLEPGRSVDIVRLLALCG